MKTAPPAGRYDAFISHSHAADGKLAPALRQALHQFGKPLFKLRALNAFRERESSRRSRVNRPSFLDSRFLRRETQGLSAGRDEPAANRPGGLNPLDARSCPIPRQRWAYSPCSRLGKQAMKDNGFLVS